jgi:hypothetical protein
MEGEDDDDDDLIYTWTQNRGAIFLSGFRSRSTYIAGLVANANAVNVSVVMLIQSS